MMLNCEDCGLSVSDDSADYRCVFQTGLCGACLVERVKKGEEW